MSGDWLKSGRMLALRGAAVLLAGWAGMGLALEPLPEEAPAVAAVKARGGAVDFDAAGHLVKVDLGDRPATDADLALLAEVPSIESLELWGAEITNKGMPSLAKLTGLKQLVLENTDVTDAGAKALEKLTNLKVLNLRR